MFKIVKLWLQHQAKKRQEVKREREKQVTRERFIKNIRDVCKVIAHSKGTAHILLEGYLEEGVHLSSSGAGTASSDYEKKLRGESTLSELWNDVSQQGVSWHIDIHTSSPMNPDGPAQGQPPELFNTKATVILYQSQNKEIQQRNTDTHNHQS